jgi:hypothetical protein
MFVQRMHHEIEVATPAGDAFAFVSTARNWERFHPMTLGVRGDVDHPAVAGEEIVEYATTRPSTLVWRVLDHVPGERWSLRGWLQFGRLWRREVAVLTYTFAPSGEGTRIRREMTYEPGWFAPLLPLVRGRTERQCEDALRRLKAALEA